MAEFKASFFQRVTIDKQRFKTTKCGQSGTLTYYFPLAAV